MEFELQRSVLDGRRSSNHGRATAVLNYAYGDNSRAVIFSSELFINGICEQ